MHIGVTPLVQISAIARLGHTGASALATRDCAPSMQVWMRIIGADNGAVSIHRTDLVRSPYAREFAV